MPETPSESSRRARLVARWEALPARHQFRYAYLAGLGLLLTLHLGGIATGVFPHLSVWLGIGYSVGEALIFAGAAVFATRTEIMRKARMAEAQARHEARADQSDK